MDFLETLRKFASSNPDIVNGLFQRRRDFREQIEYLARVVETYPPEVFASQTDDEPSDSMMVEVNESFTFLDDYGTTESADGGNDQGNEDRVEAAPDMQPDVVPLKDSSLDDSVTVADAPGEEPLAALPEVKTVEGYLLRPKINVPHADLPFTSVASRTPRACELHQREEQMEELVFLDDFTRRIHGYLVRKHLNLDKRVLTPRLLEILRAGAIVANSTDNIYSEADIEFVCRAAQCIPITEIINYLDGRSGADRLHPHKGTRGSRTGESHAITDIEMGGLVAEVKTTHSIDINFISHLLGLEHHVIEELVRRYPGFGLRFAWKSPRTFLDSMNSKVQPLVQLWTQLREKRYLFGMGSSNEFVFLVMKDPQHPKRLYISRCHSTLLIGSEEAKSITPNPTESGLYAMFNLMRIASKTEYRDEFLRGLRRDMKTKIIPVNWRDITKVAAKVKPTTKDVSITNVSKGTVGVTFCDQVGSKAGITREDNAKRVVRDWPSDGPEAIDQSGMREPFRGELDASDDPQLQGRRQATARGGNRKGALRSTVSSRARAEPTQPPSSNRVTRSVSKAAAAADMSRGRGRGMDRGRGRGRGLRSEYESELGARVVLDGGESAQAKTTKISRHKIFHRPTGIRQSPDNIDAPGGVKTFDEIQIAHGSRDGEGSRIGQEPEESFWGWRKEHIREINIFILYTVKNVGYEGKLMDGIEEVCWREDGEEKVLCGAASSQLRKTQFIDQSDRVPVTEPPNPSFLHLTCTPFDRSDAPMQCSTADRHNYDLEEEDEDEYEERDITISAPPASQLLSKSTLPPEPLSPSSANSSVDPQATAKDRESLPALLDVETPKAKDGEGLSQLLTAANRGYEPDGDTKAAPGHIVTEILKIVESRSPSTPLVQLWKQLREEGCLFEIAYNSEESAESSHMDSGAYAIFNSMRIATGSDSDEFLGQLHEEMDEQGNLVPVYWRDIERVGVDLPSKAEGAVANVREGIVGVTYYDHAGSPQEAVSPAEDVEEERSVEELLLQHPEVLPDSDTEEFVQTSSDPLAERTNKSILSQVLRSTKHAGEVKAFGRVTRSVTKAAQANTPADAANQGGARGRRGGRVRG
ncbi:hypothetical protein R3P38DRAFT_3363436 [Favolaschia claudopus]|uniref:Uncharacterized protein n=1 Tax=Favolaschia claudopus TaxID=2862362 RepID=A0AAW0AM69_9AGAR